MEQKLIGALVSSLSETVTELRQEAQEAPFTLILKIVAYTFLLTWVIRQFKGLVSE